MIMIRVIVIAIRICARVGIRDAIGIVSISCAFCVISVGGIRIVRMSVGISIGTSVGISIGTSVGIGVGIDIGTGVGVRIGINIGVAVRIGDISSAADVPLSVGSVVGVRVIIVNR